MLIIKQSVPPLGKTEANKIRAGGSDPFVVAFVYPKDGEAKMFCGWYTEVLLRCEIETHYVAHLVFYGSKRAVGKPSGSAWISSHFVIRSPRRPYGPGLYKSTGTERLRSWTVSYPQTGISRRKQTFRRLPRRWIAAYDQMIWSCEQENIRRKKLAAGFHPTFQDKPVPLESVSFDSAALLDVLAGPVPKHPNGPAGMPVVYPGTIDVQRDPPSAPSSTPDP